MLMFYSFFLPIYLCRYPLNIFFANAVERFFYSLKIIDIVLYVAMKIFVFMYLYFFFYATNYVLFMLLVFFAFDIRKKKLVYYGLKGYEACLVKENK